MPERQFTVTIQVDEDAIRELDVAMAKAKLAAATTHPLSRRDAISIGNLIDALERKATDGGLRHAAERMAEASDAGNMTDFWKWIGVIKARVTP